MKISQHFIQPLDILFLRGNRLFGDPGSFSDSLVPPWPSVAAGALRSAFLAQQDIDPFRFSSGKKEIPELQNSTALESFCLRKFHLARCENASTGRGLEPLFQTPADMIVRKSKNGDSKISADLLHPCLIPNPIACSADIYLLPVLQETERGKPDHGNWLTLEGWKRYLAGEVIDSNLHLVRSESLWQSEMRVGIGLHREHLRASEGALFSTRGIVMRKHEHRSDGQHQHDVGFFAETAGVDFPESFPMCFGGDGRAAVSRLVRLSFPEPDYQEIVRMRRCRMVLTSPGIFSDGWLPTGTIRSKTGWRFHLRGIRANLVCAAVPKAEIVSGFDIARGAPKPAQRAAPSGSVYWLKDVEATPDALRQLFREGLWSDPVENPARRSEGFNRLTFALY